MLWILGNVIVILVLFVLSMLPERKLELPNKIRIMNACHTEYLSIYAKYILGQFKAANLTILLPPDTDINRHNMSVFSRQMRLPQYVTRWERAHFVRGYRRCTVQYIWNQKVPVFHPLYSARVYPVNPTLSRHVY